MNTLFAYMERPASRATKPGDAIRFVASTEDVARDGLIIESTAWDLANYKRNPVVLWSHDMLGARPPIGRAEEVFVNNRRLLADIRFDQNDEFARSIESKYRNGFLNAVSVGWDTREFAPPKGPNQSPRITKAELLEISAVPVPADASALVAGRSAQRAAQRSAAAVMPLELMPADYQAAVRGLAELIVERWRAEARHWRELSELVDLDVPRR